MYRLVRDLQLVDIRGRKYIAADERQRFLATAAREPRLAEQSFAFILANAGVQVSEALVIRPADVRSRGRFDSDPDLEAPHRALA